MRSKTKLILLIVLFVIQNYVIQSQIQIKCDSLLQAATEYKNNGQYPQALDLLNQISDILEANFGTDNDAYYFNQNNIAFLYKAIGKYDKAIALYESVIASKERKDQIHDSNYATALSNIAAVYYELGLYENALPLYERALEIIKNQTDHGDKLYTLFLNNIALLYEKIGKYEKAYPLLQEIIHIKESKANKDHDPSYARSINNLAVFYQNIGFYEKAFPLFEKALEIRKKYQGKKHPDYAESLNNLGANYLKVEKPEKALPLFSEALLIIENSLGKLHQHYSNTLMNIASVFESKIQYDSAYLLLEQALTIQGESSGHMHPNYARTLSNLAGVSNKMGNIDKAERMYEDALVIFKNTVGSNNPDYITCYHNLAHCYENSNKNKEALAAYMEISDLSFSYLRKTFLTLAESEKLLLLDQQSSIFSHLLSQLYANKIQDSMYIQKIYTNELRLKGMILENQRRILANIRNIQDSSLIVLYNQWRLNLAIIESKLLSSIKLKGDYLDSLQNITIEIEQKLSLRSTDFNKQQKEHSVTLNSISEKLNKGEVAIEFLRFDNHRNSWTDSIIYAALLINPGESTPRLTYLFEEKQLALLLTPDGNIEFPEVFIQKLYPGKITSNENYNDPLYELIWKPLEKLLNGVRTIYYSPVGLLNKVAFQALRTNKNELLIEKYQLNNVLSTRNILFSSEIKTKSLSASLWGGIRYDFRKENIKNTSENQNKSTKLYSDLIINIDRNLRLIDTSWEFLSGTLNEVTSLAKIFNKTKIQFTIDSGAFATEEKFKLLDGVCPELIHIATHGFWFPKLNSIKNDLNELNSNVNPFARQDNPMLRCGLVLAGANQSKFSGDGEADGILTASELSQINLSNAHLVVLSACETGLGDLHGNEGLIGLSRALKMAGVEKIIVSLWRVPDSETSELMTLFYKNLVNGFTTTEALRFAQLKIKDLNSDPFYWAAFVLIE